MDGLMTSHIRHGGLQALSPLTRPLSLDPEAMGRAMSLPEFSSWRREGLLVSDSLGVPAIKRWYDPTLQAFPNRQVARDALMAGNDVVLYCSHIERIPALQRFLRERSDSDTAFSARFDEAVQRAEAYREHCERIRATGAPRAASFDEIVDETVRFLEIFEKTRPHPEEYVPPGTGGTGREEWT